MSNSKVDKMDKAYYIIVAVSSLILLYLGVLTRHTCDYGAHTAGMEKIFIRPLLNPLNWISYFSGSSYPLWFITGHFIMRVLRCPADYAAGINSGLYLVVSYLGVIKMMEYLLDEVNKRSIAILSFALLIVAPVWLPWKNKWIVLGVGGINVWHNATNICGRAIGIFALYFSMKLFDKIVESDYRYFPSVRSCILLSLLYVVSLLAKPSFAQIFAPGFGLLLICQLVKSKGRFVKQFLIFAAMAILPALRMGSSFFYYFGTGSGGGGIMTQRKGEGISVILPPIDLVATVLRSQVLVLLFPVLMVIIVLLAKRKLDRYHAISWIMMLLSIFYVLCLRGAALGEMGWALYIASFFVFLVGIRDYIKIFYSGVSYYSRSWEQVTLFMLSTLALVEQIIIGIVYLYELVICGETIF